MSGTYKLIPHRLLKNAGDFWQHVPLAASGDTSVCWPWVGETVRGGYGDYGGFRSNRVAYFLHYEIQPGRLLVLHSCDHPACCNPLHLRLGDHLANARDRIARGRGKKRRSSKNVTFNEDFQTYLG